MIRRFVPLFLVLFQVNTIFSQPEQSKLQQVVPMSPTAAALSKYGDIPVNYYTGSPNISIPLFEVSSGKLNVPVSLSYQFSGLKTEELAGWVGLGWSLNAGGVIGRTIRGMPDEIGYMVAGNMTVKYMMDNPSDPNVIHNLKQAGKGLFDTEPDIFHFNFLGYSGKFYYSQEDQKFYTLPKENITISYNSMQNSFTIITADGNKFLFDQREVTTASGVSCNGSTPPPNSYISATSAWYLSSVKNSEGTEEIALTYNTGITYDIEHRSVDSKYFLTGYSGFSFGPPPDFNEERCTQSSAIDPKRLSTINFRGGYLKFTAGSADRCDLPGDKYLQKIELFDINNVLQKRYVFSYGYFGDASSPVACNYPNNLTLRLKLLSLQEEDGAGGVAINPHTFEYEENGGFPSRLSCAQDYWGYYNNVNSNQTLIPPTIYTPPSGHPMYFPGADRTCNFDGAKMGSIKKITYPTKGETSFVFENNDTKEPLVLTNIQWHIESLEGDHNGGQTSWYEKTFVVNEPPSDLNNNLGGAFVDVLVAEPGCDITLGTSCAIFALEGLTPGTQGWGYMTAYSMTGFYLPNGTYRMTASFNQVPPQFEDYYYSIKWKQPENDTSYLVGGIRIKTIIDYDGISHNNDIIKTFTYTSDIDGKSTGKVFSYPFDNVSNLYHEFWSVDDEQCTWVSLQRAFKKRSSLSNYPLVSAGAGYVGYSQVNEKLGQNGNGGKSSFYFQSYPDLINPAFPVTHTSREWRRGLLLESKNYDAGNNLKTKETITYDEFSEYDPSISKIAFGLKVGFVYSISDNANTTCWPSGTMVAHYDLYSIPMYNEYETIAGKSIISSKVVTQYEQSAQIERTEINSYSNKNFLPVSQKITDSKAGTTEIQMKYSGDYTTSGNSPSWLYQLQQKKINEVPIETISVIKKSDNSEFVTSGTITTFKNDKPVPDQIFILETSTPIPLGSFTHSSVNGSGVFVKDIRYKAAVTFNQYDEYRNLLNQQKTGDIPSSYIWGYNKKYPVAQVIGIEHDNAVSQSGINLAVINSPATDDITMRNELNKLRNLPGVFVTTYTYKALVGVSSVTDLNGRVTYYEYDPTGRLTLVRDHEGNILKRICYNYYGLAENCSPTIIQTFYNVQASQVFTVNNCPPGYVGGQVTYTVPAGTYSSTISQAAADQLALNDIAANGQTYANSTGNCTPSGCNSGNCSGAEKKCINNICETGVRINKSSTYSRGTWTCRYVYRWSDCSESQEYTETGPTACTIGYECF